jgi:hypothetical protein
MGTPGFRRAFLPNAIEFRERGEIWQNSTKKTAR